MRAGPGWGTCCGSRHDSTVTALRGYAATRRYGPPRNVVHDDFPPLPDSVQATPGCAANTDVARCAPSGPTGISDLFSSFFFSAAANLEWFLSQ